VDHGRLSRYAAPAAFLLAATIAVVLIRSGLETGGGSHRATTAGLPASVRTAGGTTTATTARKPARARRRYWVVRAGDTFAVISAKSSVPVATIARLNPTVHATALFIGEKIRLK
jgi:LysM repeat protein